MELITLCNTINLQPQIKSRVLAFAATFDFTSVAKQLEDFRNYGKMSEVLASLQEILGADPDGIKILTCMLQASANIHDMYRPKGISDEIYFATMRCYPRFISETYKMTGELCFDRYWWTTRQAGGHLFRIGSLEYEMKHIDGGVVIGIHVPSDADLSPAAVDRSLESAKHFFAEYFPELSCVEYRCHSWLLDRQLQGFLGEDSNILSFQRRFEIFDEGEISSEVVEWVFQTKSADYSGLPENTLLQRSLKRHLLSGGVIRNAYGRVIRESVFREHNSIVCNGTGGIVPLSLIYHSIRPQSISLSS